MKVDAGRKVLAQNLNETRMGQLPKISQEFLIRLVVSLFLAASVIGISYIIYLYRTNVL